MANSILSKSAVKIVAQPSDAYVTPTKNVYTEEKVLPKSEYTKIDVKPSSLEGGMDSEVFSADFAKLPIEIKSSLQTDIAPIETLLDICSLASTPINEAFVLPLIVASGSNIDVIFADADPATVNGNIWVDTANLTVQVQSATGLIDVSIEVRQLFLKYVTDGTYANGSTVTITNGATTPATPASGDIWINGSTVQSYDGSAWNALDTQIGTRRYPTLSQTKKASIDVVMKRLTFQGVGAVSNLTLTGEIDGRVNSTFSCSAGLNKTIELDATAPDNSLSLATANEFIVLGLATVLTEDGNSIGLKSFELNMGNVISQDKSSESNGFDITDFAPTLKIGARMTKDTKAGFDDLIASKAFKMELLMVNLAKKPKYRIVIPKATYNEATSLEDSEGRLNCTKNYRCRTINGADNFYLDYFLDI